MDLNWKHLTLIGAGLLAGLVVLAWAFSWPPFPDGAPRAAAPAPVTIPPDTDQSPAPELPPTTTARPLLSVPEPAATITTTTTTTTTTLPEALAEGSDLQEADGSGASEDVPCWSVTEGTDVFSDFVLLESVCVFADDPQDKELPSSDGLLGGEGVADGDVPSGDGLLGGEGVADGDVPSGDRLLGGEAVAEESSTARLGWRCAVQTGRIEMFASTGRPPTLLPNGEVMVLLRLSGQDEPAVPSWEIQDELDEEGEFMRKLIVYEGLWRPNPALDHDRAGLPTSETDHPLTGIQDSALKNLPQYEQTTARSAYDQRAEHAQHAPHLVHAPQDTADDALEWLRRTDTENASLHISIGSVQLTFDISGWEDHIAALDPC